MLNNFQITDNFNLREFECTHPEHSHVQIDDKLVELLQKLRDRLNVPLIVNSAFRCEVRNNQVGGATRSQHLYGKAADIAMRTIPLSIEEVAEIADELGFDGIGLYNTFIHLDVRGSKARWDNR